MLALRRSAPSRAPSTATTARGSRTMASSRASADAAEETHHTQPQHPSPSPLPLPLPQRPPSSAGGGGLHNNHDEDNVHGTTHLLADLAKAALSSAAAAVITAAPAHGGALAAAAVSAVAPPAATASTPLSALKHELMLEGALHISGPQLGSCLQRYGSSLQRAVDGVAPSPSAAGGLSSPRQRSLTQEEAVCLATPLEPAPVREQRMPAVPRLPSVANANANGNNSGLSNPVFMWQRSAAAAGEGANGGGGGALGSGGNGNNSASSPVAAVVRRLGRRAGLSQGGARALLEEAVGAGASYDAADDEGELIACRRTAASIAARVGAAHATRRERRRLVVRARLAARGLLAGLGSRCGSGGGDGAAA